MNDLLDDDEHGHSGNERELTLSTGAILGIFLTLVLLCGACFGVGYNMGRKSAPTPLALDNNANEPLTDAASTPKPSASTPAETTAVTPPPPIPKPSPVVRKPPALAPEATPVTAEDHETPTPPPARPALPPTAAPGTGTIMVQVAAVSHQEDADLLLGALRARGYTVSARPSGADNFIHVQVGPFKDKKDAEAMRQRLLSDGYNALLKF